MALAVSALLQSQCKVIKPEISHLVHTRRFLNNLHRVLKIKR
jgi:hypothetical protein